MVSRTRKAGFPATVYTARRPGISAPVSQRRTLPPTRSDMSPGALKNPIPPADGGVSTITRSHTLASMKLAISSAAAYDWDEGNRAVMASKNSCSIRRSATSGGECLRTILVQEA